MFRAACGKRVFNARPVRPSPVNCRLFSSDSVKTEFQQKLRTEGFTDVQAETAIKCLHKMIDESMKQLSMYAIARTDGDQTIRSYRNDFVHIKSEIHLLEKNDYAILKQESERIAEDVQNLKSKMRDDLQKLHSGVRLDMNMDKARIRDEQSALKLKITETHNRLEKEVTDLRTVMDSAQLDTIKIIFATTASFGLSVLGWLRFWK